MRLTGRHALLFLAAAALLVVVMGPWAVPVIIVASLLLTGRFVGEELILAARLARTAPARAARARWSRRHAAALVSLLERAPRSERGPPALIAV
jgi:hypothetical protein